MSEYEFGSTIDEVVEKKAGSKFRKTEFIQLGQGEHTIRILDPMETKNYSHYVGWSWLKCIGDECPICENNKKIMYEHPEDFRDVSGWLPRRDRYFINVLDKTPSKVCTKCATETKDIRTANCSACGTPLPDAAPLNKVKVLSRGKTLFEDLKVMSRSIRNEQDERIDIRSYDFRLVVRGAGRDTTITVIPLWVPGKENNPSVAPEELFDLEKATVELSRDEMIDVAYNKTSLKDIFTLRRAKKQLEDSDFLKPDISGDMNAAVDEIFKA
jgi:hypothetical protein